MDRVDSQNNVQTLPSPEEAVSDPGYFSHGNMDENINGTIVPAWWLNAVQEELLNIILNGHLPDQSPQVPSRLDYAQAYKAILKIIEGHPTVTESASKIDTAYNLAAQAKTEAEDAQETADEALETANDGVSKAEAAKETADQGLALANGVNALIKIALGQYTVTTETIDLNTIFNPVKFCVVTIENETHENLPTGLILPAFLDVLKDENTAYSIQIIRDLTGNVFFRSATLALVSDITTPSWGSWMPFGGNVFIDDILTQLKTYIAEHIGNTLKYKGSFVDFYTTSPPASASEGDIYMKKDGSAIATWTDGAWVTSSYTPELFELWANTTDKHGYYWFHGEWNILDFNADLSTKEDTANKVNTLASTIQQASSTNYPSELAVVTALGNMTGEIPDVTNLQSKLSGTSGDVVVYTNTAGTLSSLGVDSTVTASSSNLVTSGAVAALDFCYMPLHTKSGEDLKTSLPPGYTYAQLVYVNSDGTNAVLTISKTYSTGTLTLSTTSQSILGYDGIGVTFISTVTDGTEADFMLKLTKV